MKVQDVLNCIEEMSPLTYAEDFDNVGLLVGDPEHEVTGILVTLDTIEPVIEEAIQKNCNVVVSFHPIIFSGLKKLTGKNYVERVVIRAIRHEVAIISMHTALDNDIHGVNDMICQKLKLTDTRILLPKKDTIFKLFVNVPTEKAKSLSVALTKVGAGNIGNYKDCSFSTEGTGTFTPVLGANPVVGNLYQPETVRETQLQFAVPKHCKNQVLSEMFKNHPYEEIAYDLISLQNSNQQIGIGKIGKLPTPIAALEFLQQLKETFNAKGIRHTQLLDQPVQTVAVLGGSGSFAIQNAIRQKADIFITADLKYHQFYEAEGKIVLVDIGHYESEQFTKNLIVGYLQKKISNFAIILSEINTNPIQYL